MSDSDNNVQQFTVQDMVNYAMKKDAANLSTAFNSVIGSKVLDAIQQKKIDIAKKIMNPDAAVSGQEEGEEEIQAAATETEAEDQESVAAETTTTGETNDEVAQQNT